MNPSDDKKILVQDAQGKLYAIPMESLEELEIQPDIAKNLINIDSRMGQNAELSKLSIVTQLSGSDLPNFRLLMQTEYK